MVDPEIASLLRKIESGVGQSWTLDFRLSLSRFNFAVLEPVYELSLPIDSDAEKSSPPARVVLHYNRDLSFTIYGIYCEMQTEPDNDYSLDVRFGAVKGWG